MLEDGKDPFAELCKEPLRKEKLTWFVDQFGKHGPAADMAWCVVQVPWNLLPGWKRPVTSGESPHYPDAYRIQLLVAEIEVRRFLGEPKALARYYDILAWEGSMLRKDNIWLLLGKTRDRLRKGRDEEYWIDARTFLILAYATGREDMLKNADPEKLSDRFEEWYWFEVNWTKLRPEKGNWRWTLDGDGAPGNQLQIEAMELPDWTTQPNTPFRDWKSLPIPTRDTFELWR